VTNVVIMSCDALFFCRQLAIQYFVCIDAGILGGSAKIFVHDILICEPLNRQEYDKSSDNTKSIKKAKEQSKNIRYRR
jgi:hypothetical protein